MLEVLPIQTKEEQEALCARCGSPFRTEMLAYRAMVDGELRGICQFTMGTEGGRIVDFAHAPSGYEFEPMFVMGRAALNFIDLCGAHTLYADPDAGDSTLLRAIGLRPTDENTLFCDMTGFFDGSHCSGH